MEAIKRDGEYFCPECGNQLPKSECVRHSPPRGMPSCLLSCLCKTCNKKVCCEREGPEPRLEPKKKPKRDSGRSFGM